MPSKRSGPKSTETEVILCIEWRRFQNFRSFGHYIKTQLVAFNGLIDGILTWPLPRRQRFTPRLNAIILQGDGLFLQFSCFAFCRFAEKLIIYLKAFTTRVRKIL